jgi:tetratricopeptide (TPR) repeat protein
LKRCARKLVDGPRCLLGHWLGALLILATIGSPWAWAADDEPAAKKEPSGPFYEQEPYDLVILNDTARTQLKVLPLTLPGGKVPPAPRPTDKLRIRRFEDSDDEYDVQWQDIAEVRTFDQLVLEQARQLVATAKFNDALDYYAFLRREYPKAAGLDDAIADYLYEEAKDWQRKRNYENALVLLRTLYDRQPQRAGLEAAMAAATGKLIDNYVAAGDHTSVRRLVKELRTRFPAGATAARFEAQMNERAMKVVADGRDALTAGDPQQALSLARRAMAIWPKAAGGKELAEEAFTTFPHVVVGVTTPYSPGLDEFMVQWSVRRTRRLIARQLFEFTGYGANGGEYQCPVGRWEATDLGRGMAIDIRPDIPWRQGDMLSGYDVARRLLALAQRGRPDFLPAWSEACQSIEVHSVNNVVIHFHEPQLAPAALLTVPFVGSDQESNLLPPSVVPYVVEPSSPERTTFLAGKEYFARTTTEPQGVIEQLYATRADAAEALRLGVITAVDRLNPWQVGSMKSAPGVSVERYCVPTVHCLLPNLTNRFMRQRGLRRALVYGINRPKILTDEILKKQVVPGCEVVSGPFSKGAALSDPAGYAYDDEIVPRSYEPRLALTLSAVALREVAAAAVTEKDPPKELPALTLAHPADDVARIACKAIQRNLEAINITVNLREIPLGQPTRLADGDDLLYLELAIEEPLVQARRLFGDGGLIGSPSTYMSVVLRQVETATGWNEARQALHDLHRLTFDEVSVVPLWQLTEHYAHHDSLSGVATQPASLYQGIEQWQVKVPLPAVEP